MLIYVGSPRSDQLQSHSSKYEVTGIGSHFGHVEVGNGYKYSVMKGF